MGDSVQSCLEDYFKEEEINKECDGCKDKTMTKKMNIKEEPSTVIIQLKRYFYCKEEKKQRKDMII